MPLLWVRDLASGELRSLSGTEDGTMPFWSPDSRDLGFFAGNDIEARVRRGRTGAAHC